MAVATKKGTADPSADGLPGSARLPAPGGAENRAQADARHAISKNTVQVSVPGLGELTQPLDLHLAWYGGLATITALGIIDQGAHRRPVPGGVRPAGHPAVHGQARVVLVTR